MGRADGQQRTGDELWRFSLALYGRPGVADALLALQDRAGCDVNLILFGLWLGVTQARAAGHAELAAAKSAAAPVGDTVVAPLRRLRRQLKTAGDDVQGLRRRIAALELAAERSVQCRLASGVAERRCAEPAAARIAAATANLALCLGAEASSPEADVLRCEVAALARSPGGPRR